MHTDPIMVWQSVLILAALAISTVYYIATQGKKN